MNVDISAAPDLSVITVCRNASDTIERCISSVQPLLLNNSLRTEYIVIDGASTDSTIDILCRAQETGRVTRYISEPDSGIYDAMNKGLRLAAGKVCVFINADDELRPDGVPACCAPILNGEAEFVYSTAAVRDASGKECSPVKPKLDSCFIDLPCNHQAMFAKTDLLRRMGGFRKEKFKIAADVDLMRRLHVANIQPAVVDAVPCVFYLGGVSSSVVAAEEWIRLILEYREYVVKQIKATPEHAKTLLNVLRYNLCAIAGEKSEQCIHDMQALQWAAELVSGVKDIMPVAKREKIVRRLRWKAFKYTYRALYKWKKSRRMLRQARICRLLADMLK